MIFSESALPGCYVIDLEPVTDNRGWFARFYCKNEFAAIGHKKEWVQLNHSVTLHKGSIRGMHFQKSPFREIKMVRCVAGAIFDVVIDLRKDSPSFLQWFGIELSARNKKMLYIPEGFAHGFQTLEDNCELIYHHTEIYQPGFEGAIRFNDPLINIQWPLPVSIISERDLAHPLLEKNFKGL